MRRTQMFTLIIQSFTSHHYFLCCFVSATVRHASSSSPSSVNLPNFPYSSKNLNDIITHHNSLITRRKLTLQRSHICIQTRHQNRNSSLDVMILIMKMPPSSLPWVKCLLTTLLLSLSLLLRYVRSLSAVILSS